jgi:hypothetical protein
VILLTPVPERKSREEKFKNINLEEDAGYIIILEHVDAYLNTKRKICGTNLERIIKSDPISMLIINTMVEPSMGTMPCACYRKLCFLFNDLMWVVLREVVCPWHHQKKTDHLHRLLYCSDQLKSYLLKSKTNLFQLLSYLRMNTRIGQLIMR